MSDVKVNREYKDRLFRFRFGTEAYKEDMLSLYNALNGTAYGNAEELSITTIEDVIYVGMKNVVSILLDGNLLLFFYNGTDNSEAVVQLKLSDAFIHESKGDFEWMATVYNLNRGKNDKLLEQCRPLSEYMELINSTG